MPLKERKTPHNSRCPECLEMLFREFSDEELKQLVAGTLSFICTKESAHKWSPTKDEKDAFVKILLSDT